MNVGQVLKQRYRLERLLGVGGVSRVYQACDLLHEQLGEPDPYVAIKVLNDEYANAQDASLLLYGEFALTRHVHHPNVVHVYHFDVDLTAGRAFFTLELMRGLTLSQLQRERPEGLPWPELREIAIGMLDALAHAHDSGVLHGDLKPCNVMLTERGLRLFDFGLGRAGQAPLDALPQLDRSRCKAWTAAYAAPELLEGGVLTPAADVFAVACVIHELACGTHPFMRLDALRARAERLDRSLRVPRHLPAACRSILRRALSLDTHERLVSARDLCKAFQETPYSTDRRWL
jgi:serine/threonine-protein kinase Stk1